VSDYERRYAPTGKVAHLLRPHYYGDHVSTVLCGLWAWHASWWRGTGSQDEYERAAALPVCKNCERKAAS